MPHTIVNVFAPPGGPGGNPAAVVRTDALLSLDAMASTARRLRLAACAFVSGVVIKEEGAASATLAWFSKEGAQLALCGHGTLAASIYLLAALPPTVMSISFATLPSGRILVARRAQSASSAVEILFPAAAVDQVWEGQEKLRLADRIAAVVDGLQPAGIAAMAKVGRYVVVALDDGPACRDKDLLGSFDVDSVALGTLVEFVGLHVALVARPGQGRRTPWSPSSTAQAVAEPDHHIQSRVFCPSVGLLEDECTGSSVPALIAFCDHFRSDPAVPVLAAGEVVVWQRGPLGGGRVAGIRREGGIGVVGEGAIVDQEPVD